MVKPATGRYPVLVDAEVLALLFNNHVSQLSSANSYNGLPFVKIGDELVAGARGDLITLTLDPRLGSARTRPRSPNRGCASSPLRLVERNRVVANATDKRYADYLSIAASTTRGNVVVEPGTATREELTRLHPRVLEVLQFSALFADPNSGTFGSEIRLARLHDNVTGQVTYLKGGSLAGSFSENFRDARFSSRRVRQAHFSNGSSTGRGYYGPEHALLGDVSIVG